MEEERHEEELKADPYSLPHKPYTWLMIRQFDKLKDYEQYIFYNIAENRYYARFVPQLKYKEVLCCYGGWLVLCDWSTQDCSILNILTMEKFQLPLPPQKSHGRTHCVLSSSKMDRRCRVILFQESYFYLSGDYKFYSCYIGDSEIVKGKLTLQDGGEELTLRGGRIRDLINFKGKLYALVTPDFNLFASDFSDPALRLRHVISGQSVTADFIFTYFEENINLVESCEDLLLIFMCQYVNDISDVRIFKADFSIGEWVKLETLGDRAIFLGSVNNSFSSPASALGMKGNVVYWFKCYLKYLCMYDIENKSISMSLPVPIEESFRFSSWASFSMTCNEEKKLERKDMSFLFEVSPIETTFRVQQGKATTESIELQIEQRNPQKSEETKILGKTKIWSLNGLCVCGVRKPQNREETKTIFRKEKLWEDLPNDLLLEIFQYLFGGDRVVFRSVCRSWYSISPSRSSSQKFVLPMKPSDCSSPFLMCPDNKICHPIFGDLYRMDSLDISGSKVRAVRDGWQLMDNSSKKLFFYNPITKEERELPDCNDAWFYYSVFFSAPPTSANCLVVVAAELDFGCTSAICYMEIEDEDWTYYEISQGQSFYFSNCNPVAFKDQYYFLGDGAKLLIFCPKKTEFCVIEAPKFISSFMVQRGQQYMLESDGKLIAVFVSVDGSSVYTCEWNVSTSEWEILVSLANIMLFVSRPLSLCKRAIVRGTGNKIYFPRVVGEGHILFYSLATKRYHTFEMGTTYSNFFDSKFFPQQNGWFMP